MNTLKVFATHERMRAEVYEDLPDSGCTLHMSQWTLTIGGRQVIYRVVADERDVERLRGLIFTSVKFCDEVPERLRASVLALVWREPTEVAVA